MESVITVSSERHDRDALQAILALLDGSAVQLSNGTTTVEMPESVHAAVRGVLVQACSGQPFTIVPIDDEVSPSEAARVLGVSRQYVDRLIADGVLPARRLPGSRYRRLPVPAVLAHRQHRDSTRSADPSSEIPAPAAATTTAAAGTGTESAAAAPNRTPRGWARRAQLVEATARLVGERGFHLVGISEIAAAAGVTGAAIYRHFPNKTQMLVAVLDQVVDELLEGSAKILAAGGSPEHTLEQLVRHHVRLVLRNPALFGIYLQEAAALPADDRSRLRGNQRTYVLRWAAVLGGVDPSLSADEARTRSQVTFGLLNSLAEFPSRMAPAELSELLTTMALASLNA